MEKPSVTDTERLAVRRRLTSKTELPVIGSEKRNESGSSSENLTPPQDTTRPLSGNSQPSVPQGVADELFLKQPRLGDRTFPVSVPAPPLRNLDLVEVKEEEAETHVFSITSSMEPNMGSEECLLVGGKREINLTAPEWQTAEAKGKILAGVQKKLTC